MDDVNEKSRLDVIKSLECLDGAMARNTSEMNPQQKKAYLNILAMQKTIAEEKSLIANTNELGHTYVTRSGKVIPCTSAEKRRLEAQEKVKITRWQRLKLKMPAGWYEWLSWWLR